MTACDWLSLSKSTGGKTAGGTVLLLLLSSGAVFGQELRSEPGPTFRVADSQLANPLTFIAYGDQRFTDPANVISANPRIRQWLANQVAAEKPAAVILNGDVPLHGDVPDDYAVFRKETQAWRDAHLRVFPAIGNHEISGQDPKAGIEAWWKQFPELRNRRWYSVALGSRVYVLALDSESPLLPGSEQAQWIEGQINGLPETVDFVVITMHRPPVADVQETSLHRPQPAAERNCVARLSFRGGEDLARPLPGGGGAYSQLRT